MDEIDQFIQDNIDLHLESYAPVRVVNGEIHEVKSKRTFFSEELFMMCNCCGRHLFKIKNGEPGDTAIDSDEYEEVHKWVAWYIAKTKAGADSP